MHQVGRADIHATRPKDVDLDGNVDDMFVFCSGSGFDLDEIPARLSIPSDHIGPNGNTV
jgi:hypothetical protein